MACRPSRYASRGKRKDDDQFNTPDRERPTRPLGGRQTESSGLPLADASALVMESENRLWTPEGAAALANLRSRCLTEATIRAAAWDERPAIMIPIRDGVGYWRPSGVTI